MPTPTFHFFTLVTKTDQYEEMRDSLARVGFGEENSVFTVLDNREGNAHEPYSAITAAVKAAQAPYLVFCHQDLVFYHGPEALLERIQEVAAIDPKWAVLGNAGWTSSIEMAAALDDHAGAHSLGKLPAKVLSLDENLLVIRKDSGVGCSPELSGFHLYATDLVLNAYRAGFSAYVIDYRLMHKGSTLDYAGLHEHARRFHRVWRREVKGALIATPAMVLLFSRVPFLFAYMNRIGKMEWLMWDVRRARTLDYVLRYGRPSWLPTARFVKDDFWGPQSSDRARMLYRLTQGGRSEWPDRLLVDEIPLFDRQPGYDVLP